MRTVLTIIVAVGCARCLFAGPSLPLTTDDISLMLRSGCSSEMIVRDVAVRHFSGPLDSEDESQLRRQNASQALVDALKNAKYTASEEELAQARKRIDDANAAAQKATEQQAAEQSELSQEGKRLEDARAPSRKFFEQQAINQSQPASYGKKADADRQYLLQLADAEKLNGRVKAVLSSWSTSNGFSNTLSTDPETNRDQRRVLLRAQEAAKEEFSGNRQAAWRRVGRINELMQDESFVRDSLK